MLKKVFLISLLTMLSFFAIGCGKNSQTNNSKKNYENKQINGLSIEIKDIVELQKTKESGKNILRIKLKGINESPEPQSFDAMQVSVKTSEGKFLDIYPSTSFGVMLSSGEQSEGDVFFLLEKKLLPAQLIYENPDTHEKIEWEIKSIKKGEK